MSRKKINTPEDFRPETLKRLESFALSIVTGKVCMGFVTFTEEVANCCRHGTDDEDENLVNAEKLAAWGFVNRAVKCEFSELLKNAHIITMSSFLEFRAAEPNGPRSDTLVIIYRDMGVWMWISPTFFNHFESPAANAANRKCDRLWITDPHQGYLTENVPSRFLRFNVKQAISGYKRVLGLGNSAGGTQALMNSDLCTATLTFCPPVVPKYTPGMSNPDAWVDREKPWVEPLEQNVDLSRYTRQYSSLLKQRLKDSTGRNIVCVGTYEPDQFHLKFIRDIPSVEIKQFDHDSHVLPKFLKSKGLLDDMITDFVKST